MNLDEAKAQVQRWVDDKLSVPSPAFQNLPPCPYSKPALLKNKVDIRCADSGPELLAQVAEMARSWDDRYELALIATEPENIEPEALAAFIAESNARLEADDLVCFFDHPRSVDPKYKITSANGKYVFVGMQRLSLFVDAARPLQKKNYFENVSKQYGVTRHLEPLPAATAAPASATAEDRQFQSFAKLLREARAHSKFYAETLAGIDPDELRSFRDLDKLPILETGALVTRGPDLPAVPRSRLRRVLVSGGTTGNPKVCFFADNLDEILRGWAETWRSCIGLTPEDLVAVLCPLPLASGTLITEVLEGIGCSTIPLGLTTPPEVTARLMKLLGATAIVSHPSTVVMLGRDVRALGYEPKDFALEKILVGSEVLTERTRRHIEREWGCEVFDTSGSSELGMIGAECGQHDGHHLAMDSAYFEVLDLETRAPVEEGSGRLYAITLQNLGLPLIRYDMKDLVRITREPCPCGVATPRIWFMGRADDRLILKTAVKLYAYQVDDALEGFDEITSEYNLIATDDGDVDAIRVIIEAADPAYCQQALAQRVSEAIIESSLDFRELYDAGLVRAPEIEFTAIGSLERTVRRKIKDRFRDQRTNAS